MYHALLTMALLYRVVSHAHTGLLIQYGTRALLMTIYGVPVVF